MGGEDEEQEYHSSSLVAPLTQPKNFSSSDHDDDFDDDGSNHHQIRTGSTWSGAAHIITGVIGAGVLSIAWSIGQLGWIAGPLAIIAFAAITFVSTFLLSDCYRYQHRRCPSYNHAVRFYLGEKWEHVSGVFVMLSLSGTAIAYIITSASSVRAIMKSNCYHKEGHEAECSYGDIVYMLLFGVVQIFMSQIPDYHNMAWLSIIAAIMSFSYSFIGFGLGFAKVIENGTIKGSITGIPASNIANKLWLAFQALGDIAFAYPYAVILLPIQDTLKSPPAENKTMKKASMVAIFVTTFFYLCCGCFGYAAFGNDTPGNLLTGFGFYEPFWLIDFANACIVLHLVGGYQIYSQPIFSVVEKWFIGKFPESGFVNNFHKVKLPFLPLLQLNSFRLCFRTAYVMSTTGVAMLFPYFNQVLGVLGALGFWPLAIYFPVEMYFIQKKIVAWSRQWIVLRTFSFFCFLVTVVGLIGSLQGLISAKLS
ncbi:probable amino acid permease 7 [Humulus lupulus]|uniref:probable amino acid permease 7 n=1 Tax=Humulus lupulus TaxID=3486 RepID=UPI002B40CC74|nr:probable amino acid permease 7 [Humulus lupulus]